MGYKGLTTPIWDYGSICPKYGIIWVYMGLASPSHKLGPKTSKIKSGILIIIRKIGSLANLQFLGFCWHVI